MLDNVPSKVGDTVIREIRKEDIEPIVSLAVEGFGEDIAFEPKHYENQLALFPEGQICADHNGKIIGSSSSLIVNLADYNHQHTFDEMSGNGYIRNHQPDGLNLYGIEVVVDPNYRHMKIGQQLYEARRKLCQQLNLKSVVIGGRIPNYYKYADQLTAREYVDQVLDDKIYDPVLTFQKKNGFVLKDVISNYLPEDEASLKYATLMGWFNEDYRPE